MPPAPSESQRLPAPERRELLLDVAKELLIEEGSGVVTMGTVAERAEVTRTLVYKHFNNRDEILAALYHRETAAMDRRIQRAVLDAPEGFESKLRAYVSGVLEEIESHADFFAPLRSYGSAEKHRADQRSWDRRTARWFTRLAAESFGLDKDVAEAAMGVLLGGVTSLLDDVRIHRSTARRQFLEEIYVEMTLAALERLSRRH